MKRLVAASHDFFFAPESARMLATIRICGGLVLLYEAARHWLYSVELYSTAGPALPLFSEKIANLPFLGPLGAATLSSCLLAALLTLTIGWQTRLSAAVAFFLSLWLWPLDAVATFAKYSVLGIHLLGILAVSGAGHVWSVDAALGPTNRLATPWPRRLLQLLVCAVYLGAALTKLKLPGFANGDLLTYSLLDEHWGSGSSGLAWGQRLVLHPQVVLVISQFVLLIELLFSFLVWVGPCRRTVLAAAFLLHAGMGALMHLGVFSGVMITLLLSFLEQADFALLDTLRKRAFRHRETNAPDQPVSAPIAVADGPQTRRLISRRAIVSLASLLAVWGVLSAIGAGILWRYDRSEVFGNRPVTPLREIPAADAELRLVEQLPAFEDYFHRIEIGSRFGGNQTFGLRNNFPLGGKFYVSIHTVPGHPTLSIDGLLLAPDGRQIRTMQALDASANRLILAYEIPTEYVEGDYRLIVQAEGVDVWQRRFRVGSRLKVDD